MSRVVGLLLFFSLLFSFLSCEQEEALNFPEEKRLVVLSNFSPDSLLRVSLSTTIAITDTFGTSANYPANAQLDIFEDGQFKEQLNYNSGDGVMAPFYLAGFKPKVGSTYQLQGKVADFPDVKSSGVIPPSVNIKNLELTNTTFTEDEIRPGVLIYTLSVKLLLENTPNAFSFFHLKAYRNVNGILRACELSTIENLETPLLHESGLLIKGDDFQEETLDLVLNFVYDTNTESKSPIYIELRHTEESYYRFHKSIGEQEAFGANQSILTSEAFFIHNNVENGIGNFSGYHAVLDTIGF